MHVQTNRWNEERTGHQCVGCVGYDDPVYESYTYTASCSEDVIVFDAPVEKRAFHEMVVSIQPQAQEVVDKRTDKIVEQRRLVWLNDLSAYEKDLNAFEQRNLARSWFGRIFTADHAPYGEKPNWAEYKTKALREARKDELVVTANVIISIPDDYNLFIEKLLADDYKRIIKLKEQLTEGIKV